MQQVDLSPDSFELTGRAWQLDPPQPIKRVPLYHMLELPSPSSQYVHLFQLHLDGEEARQLSKHARALTPVNLMQVQGYKLLMRNGTVQVRQHRDAAHPPAATVVTRDADRLLWVGNMDYYRVGTNARLVAISANEQYDPELARQYVDELAANDPVMGERVYNDMEAAGYDAAAYVYTGLERQAAQHLPETLTVRSGRINGQPMGDGPIIGMSHDLVRLALA
jgi:hypothetical protein